MTSSARLLTGAVFCEFLTCQVREHGAPAGAGGGFRLQTAHDFLPQQLLLIDRVK